MTDFINSPYLMKTNEGGFIFSLQDRAATIVPPLGQSFSSSVGNAEYLAARRQMERAAIIGTHTPTFDNDIGISHDAMVIKYEGKWDIGLPKSFAFALPLAVAVAEDVLSLYGEEAFFKTRLQFMAQRSTVPPNVAARKQASRMHDHENQSTPIHLTYLWSNALPTEFETPSGNTHTHENALTRFGSKERHRSIENTTSSDIRRTFAMFLAIPEPRPTRQTLIDNAAFKDRSPEGRAAAFAAADEYMRMHGGDFTPLEQPIILEEHAPAAAIA